MSEMWLKNIDKTEDVDFYHFEIEGKKFVLEAYDDVDLLELFVDQDDLSDLIMGDHWHMEWCLEMYHIMEIRKENGDPFDLEVETIKLRKEKIEYSRLYDLQMENIGSDPLDGFDEESFFKMVEDGSRLMKNSNKIDNFLEDDSIDYSEKIRDLKVSESLPHVDFCGVRSVPEDNEFFRAHMITDLVDQSLHPHQVADYVYHDHIIKYDNPVEELGEEVFSGFIGTPRSDYIKWKREVNCPIQNNRMSVGPFVGYLLEKFRNKEWMYSYSVYEIMYLFSRIVTYDGKSKRFLVEGRELYGFDRDSIVFKDLFTDWVTYMWYMFFHRLEREWGETEITLINNIALNLGMYYDTKVKYTYKFDENLKKIEFSQVLNRWFRDFSPKDVPLPRAYKKFLKKKNARVLAIKVSSIASYKMLMEGFDNAYYDMFFLTHHVCDTYGMSRYVIRDIVCHKSKNDMLRWHDLGQCVNLIDVWNQDIGYSEN